MNLLDAKNTVSWEKEKNTSTPYQGSLLLQNSTTNCRTLTVGFVSVPWRNEKDILDLDTYILCERILTAILNPLVCMLGIAANILNCFVFRKLGLRHRINFLLFSHSCIDLAYVLYMFLFFVDRFYLLMIGQYNNHGPVGSFLTNTGLHTLQGFAYVSGFLSTLIASERCLCVVKPFKVDWLLKTRNMGVIICLATVILVCAHYVATEKYKIDCVFDLEINMVIYTHFPSEFYIKHTLLVNIISGALYGLGLPTVFISVTIITTIITAVHLKSAKEWRQKARTGQTTLKDVAVTKMLISTSCLFIAFKSPDIVLRTTPLVVSDFRVGGFLQNSFITFVYTFILTSTMNSSFNIFIYFKMGSKYRRTLKNVCGLPNGKLLNMNVITKLRHSVSTSF